MARTNHPIPPACGIYYFEIEVLSKGQKAHISIGFTTSDARLNKLPGWEKNSWGYHGDDGFSFAAEKTGTTYGPTFGAGDIIGAGVDFSQNRAFFTKNGVHLGMVFEHIAEGVQVYPSVGLRHPNEGVRVNFGHTAFKFDIDDHVQQQRDAVWAGIQRTRIDWRVLDAKRSSAPSGSIDATAFGEIHDAGNRDTDMVDAKADEEGRDEASRLVLSYLVHHGYAKTAEALEAQLARAARARNSEDASNALPVPPPAAPPADSELDDADSPMAAPESEPQPETKALTKRLAIVDAVRRGDIDDALDGLRTRFPSVLARDDLLVQLKLRCRKFVELVNAAAEMKRRADFERDLDLGGAGKADEHGGEGAAGVDVAAMDVDDVPAPSSPSAQSKSAAEGALRTAIAYGKALRADYRHDLRPEVQGCLDKSFGVVAYHFPMDAGGEVGRWAGQEARDVLAGEVNQAILESQGFPARPALERVYRQTAASLVQLGFLGVGAAVFADVQRELLDT
ncbi:SPRY-domain-containing protein [Auriscalpium vulgare]|uniref:SPRY-domain-containing protein n=1 Tax=Auriscalpium vulgare TaxID=40419 RepID=A0ACB8RJK0_9AGAM|nr:SPRY-domain-containing protein [Auriscalpium vulgare]